MSAVAPLNGLLQQPGGVSIRVEPGSVVVRLAGEIDLALSAELNAVAAEAIRADRPVRLEVAAVTFIDSAAVGFMAVLAAAGQERGWRPVLVGAHRRLAETLALAGVSDLFDVEP
jgi:anti-anti-sigma factor